MSERPAFEIRMEHPNKNALGPALVGWLEERFAEAGERPILLTGEGGAFCAGLDLRHVAALDAAEMEAWLRRLDRLVVRLFEHPAPTVALVNGHAIAGGCVLAVCCDHRVATDDERVRIGANEVALGACFPPAILAMMQHRLPAQHRSRVLLGAELFTPREALRLGLVDEVAEDAEPVARRRLAALAAHPPGTYAITKAALRAGAAPGPEDERRFVEDEVPIWTSPAIRARVLAVLER